MGSPSSRTSPKSWAAPARPSPSSDATGPKALDSSFGLTGQNGFQQSRSCRVDLRQLESSGRGAPMGIFGKSKRQKAQELFETGSKGVGTVLQVQDTGMTVNDNPRVKMAWRVEPLDGGEAFDVQKTITVSRVEIPRQGDRHPVWYDPQDTSTWAYATVADEQGRATMR